MIRELEKARHFKEKLKQNEVCLGAQIGLADATVAEIFGRAGYDDTETTNHFSPAEQSGR